MIVNPGALGYPADTVTLPAKLVLPRGHITEWRRVRALPGVEWMRNRADQSAPPEAHIPTDFGFGIVDKGLSDILTRGQLHRLGPGLYCAQPGEPVTIKARHESTTHVRAITIERSAITAAAAELGIDDRRLGFVRYANNDIRLRVALEAMWRSATRHPDPLHLQTLFSNFIEIMFEVACNAKTRCSNLQPSARGLLRARTRILENCDTELTLDDLANEAGTSKAHFARAFHRAFGMPPFAYLMHVRVEQARRLLGRGYRPVEVAAHLCFSDQSHLHRWFIKLFGSSPSGFQRINVPALKLPEEWQLIGEEHPGRSIPHRAEPSRTEDFASILK